MRVVFAGTPVFAAAALQAIFDAGHTITGVLTQPDRPAGRGMKLQASPVKQLAEKLGIAVMQPARLRSGAEAEQALAWLQNPDGSGRPDVMVVAAYGLILPLNVLQAPLHGCLNIHASLLPRWRGAAPIHRAVEAGDRQTGITIMQMDEGLDTGDMLRVASIDVGNDSTGQLHDRLAQLGAREIVAALEQLQAGTLVPTPQPEQGVTYANKISKEEARIDWTLAAWQVRNRTAAFDPHPGSSTTFPASLCDSLGMSADLKLFEARLVPEDTGHKREAPGTVLSLDAEGMTVACGDGAVRFACAQRPGGRRMPAHQALANLPVLVGMRLGDPSCGQP